MRWLGLGLITLVTISLQSWPAAASVGLKIQPLEYNARLEAAEKQRGVVDVSNPTDQAVKVKMSVQAVRQTDNSGSLEYYDDESIAAGVKLDQVNFKLPAKGVYRLVFEIDGRKLPAGDSVAVIFAQTVGDEGSVGSSARVGTLLFINNGATAVRNIVVSNLSAGWLQVGGAVEGRYRLTNHADPARATGYRPVVTINLSPLHDSQKSTGPLVFAGRERTANFRLPTSAIGIYKLTVRAEDSQQSRWVLLLPAWGFWLLGGLAVSLGYLYFLWRKRQRAVEAVPSKRRIDIVKL